jgi:hypothetical protein
MVGVCMIAMFVVALVRARKDRVAVAAAEKTAQQKQAQRDKENLNAGTHVQLPNGSVEPKCFACKEPATQKPYMWGHDDRLGDLVRRMAGAPARIQIKRNKHATEVACDVHDPLLLEEFRMELAEDQVDKTKLESHWETRRARFQQQGVYERVNVKIAAEAGGKRRKKLASATNVVPISKAGGS